MRDRLDPKKALETILYVAGRVPDGNMYTTLKVIYLADKLHLERYGCQIFGDSYYALQYGPVPSAAYDAVKSARGDEGQGSVILGSGEVMGVKGNSIVPSRDADSDEFSESDLECLDDAIAQYGRSGFGELKDITHDQAYLATERNSKIELDAIAATLENGPEVIQHLRERYG